MDPVTAVGLAAAILQFLQLGEKVVSNTIEIHGSAQGTTKRNADVEIVILEFQKLNLEMKQKQSTSAIPNNSSQSQNGLKDLSVKCEELSKELLNLLESVKKSPNAGSFKSIRAGLKAVTSKAKVEALKAKFDELRQLLLFKEVLSMKQELEALEAHKRFDGLDHKISSLFDAIEKSQEAHKRELENLSVLGKRSRDDLEDTLQLEGQKMRKYINETNDVCRQQLDDIHKALQSTATTINAHANENFTKQLLRALSFPEMNTRRENVPEAHLKTFRWIFQANSNLPFSNFHKWLRDAEENSYWISGKAGSGKSTLMNLIWDSWETTDGLQHWAQGQKLVRLSFFFWEPGTRLQKSLQGFYRALIFQLVNSIRSLVPLAIEVLSDNQKLTLDHLDIPQIDWSEKKLRHLFKTLLRSALGEAKIFLFIDGLDELDDKEYRELDILERIDEMLLPGLKICASSRPLPIYNSHFASKQGLKLEDLTHRDIYVYVEDRLRVRLSQELEPRPHLHQVDWFIQQIAQRASGVFLWVRLIAQDVLQAIPKGDSLQDLDARLSEIPTELEDLFLHMQQRLDKSHQQHAKEYFLTMMGAFDTPYFSVFALATWEPLRSAKSTTLSTLQQNQANKHIEYVKRVLPARTAGLLEIIKFEDIDLEGNGYENYEDGPCDYWSSDNEFDEFGDAKDEVVGDYHTCTLPMRADRVTFLHRSVQDWLLSGTHSAWLPDEDIQNALENLLKASILICNWCESPSEVNCLYHELGEMYSGPLDIYSLSSYVFDLASILEEMFQTTRSDLLDEFGIVLSRHSSSDPWTTFYLRGSDERSVIYDFPGLAVYNRLWLYGDVKARQKASIDLSDYASYLLTCTRIAHIGYDEGLVSFVDQRLQDGANVNKGFQVKHFSNSNPIKFDRYLRLTDKRIRSCVDPSYSTFWIEVLIEVEYRWQCNDFCNDTMTLIELIKRCLIAEADVNVIIPTLRTLTLKGYLEHLRIFAEHSALSLLRKISLSGCKDLDFVLDTSSTMEADNLIGIGFTIHHSLHRFPFVGMPRKDPQPPPTSNGLEFMPFFKRSVQDYLSDQKNIQMRSNLNRYATSILNEVPHLQRPKWNYLLELKIANPSESVVSRSEFEQTKKDQIALDLKKTGVL